MRISQNKLAYIEEAGLMFEKLGMTRMTGRVLGYLLVCDKDAVTFDQILETLKASKGSVSNSTRQLIQIGFIEPVTFPGDRKTYYRMSDIEIDEILRNRMKLFSDFSSVLAKGRSVKERDDAVSKWLLEASVFYSWVESQIDEVIERWQQEKESIMNQHLEKKS